MTFRIHTHRRHIRNAVFLATFLTLTGSCTFASEIQSFTEPWQIIDVAAVESGIVIGMNVKEGDLVEKDQALADLNQAVLRASLEIALAHRDAVSAMKSADSELKLRSERLSKLQELRVSSNASEDEVNRAQLDFEVAEARLLQVREGLEIKRLEYERIRLQLALRTVRSPIDGVVTEIFRDIGEYVSPADPTVMTIVQLNPLRVTFSVPVSDIKNIRKGQAIPIRIEGTEKPVNATVELVSPVINAESQTVRVKAELPNPGNRIRSGARCFFGAESRTGDLAEKLRPGARQ
ncbi:MAG: efflux RND transporter periplasmic adaptor subunit [Planctomycetota bacterium]|nr:efflux RND transporter periplasmic adaptor subunit [Planctomycetota bacterium]MDA1162362.1 efflux RND transporter periplasmic adaptor subunit [Planctomycetota bacterium]